MIGKGPIREEVMVGLKMERLKWVGGFERIVLSVSLSIAQCPCSCIVKLREAVNIADFSQTRIFSGFSLCIIISQGVLGKEQQSCDVPVYDLWI